MTRNERFAVRRFAAWSALFEKFVVPELTTSQKQRLLGLREQMTSAAIAGRDGVAVAEAVALLCEILNNGLDPFET